VIEPYGQVALKGTWIPGDVAVDASLVQKTKVLGVAAVSGAGWVQLRRLEEADGYSSREAEFIALTTGLGMVPEGNSGTLYSDNKGVVAEINNILARGHREGHRPPWLSKMVYNRLWTLLERRRMIIVWRRRNSTELMQLADSFAWRCSRPEFDGQAVSEALIWKRGAGRNLDENVEHIQRVEHRYCSTGGWHLHSL
jgi:ribonuclease HI